MSRSGSFALLLFLIFVTTLEAQQPNEAITVEITNVDAVVTDGRGNRVQSLGKDDFEILVDGRRVPVANLAAVTSAQAKPARLLLLFDQGSLSIASRKPAVAAARDFVVRHLKPADKVMIMSMTRSITPRLEWTSDRSAIGRVLDEIDREAFLPRLETERRRVETQIRNSVTAERTAAAPGSTSFEQLLAAARAYASNATRETNQSIAAVAGAIGAFRGGTERKSLVLIGEGLPLNPGSDIFEYLRSVQSSEEMGSLPQAIRQGARTASPLAEAASFDVTPNVRALAAAARERGVAIYTIAPALEGGNASTPVERTGITSSSVAFTATTAMMSGYQMLANTTGGVAMIGAQAAEAMNQIAADLTTYYSIGYRGVPPTSTAGLVVKARGDYAVRATLAGQPLSADAVVEERVVGHHSGTIESNDLQIALEGAATKLEGDKQQVALKILIPVRSLKLENAGGQVTGGFTVFISTGTGTGAGDASAVTRQTHEIRWPAEALPQLLDKKMTFAVDVVLTPPRTQISVGVMDRLSQQTGYERWTPGS